MPLFSVRHVQILLIVLLTLVSTVLFFAPRVTFASCSCTYICGVSGLPGPSFGPYVMSDLNSCFNVATANCYAATGELNSASCLPIGECGPADETHGGQPVSSQPSGSAACTEGTFSDTADTNTMWQWRCLGSTNGGTDISCSVSKIIGQCGSGQNTTVPAQPSGTAACSAGTFSDTADTNTMWKWKCLGTGSVNDASCTANKIVGQCGSAQNADVSAQPSGTASCSAGTFSDTADTATLWQWKCLGTGSVNDASCSAYIPIDAVCGTADGGKTYTKPSGSAACSVGPYSNLADDPLVWNWKCLGIHSGSDITCSADIIIDGTCGPAKDTTVSSQPTGLTACDTGNFNNLTDTSILWRWQCLGINGGNNISCTANKPVPPPTVSIKANGLSPLTIYEGTNVTLSWTVGGGAASSCLASGNWGGSKSTSGGSQSLGAISASSYTYTITCTNPTGSASASVNVKVNIPPPPPINGKCGSAENTTAASQPSGSAACYEGAFSDTSDTATLWKWQCSGLNGGSNAACSANKPAPPTVYMTANGSGSLNITQGTNVTLNWSVGGSASSCSASGSWSGGKSTSGGSQSLGAISAGSYNYVITCTGPTGTDSASVPVTVNPPPVAPKVSLTANGSGSLTITQGANVTLNWSVTSGPATSCSASGSWSGGKSTSGGSQSLGALSAGSYYYVLSCSGPGGSNSSSVNVTVVQPPKPDLVVSAFSMPNGSPGQTVTASVTVRNSGNGSTGGSFKVAINRLTGSMNCSTSESGSTYTSALSAGASRTVSINVTLPTSGSYSAAAMADADCAVSESNESNNTRSTYYSVASLPPSNVSLTANGSGSITVSQGTNVTLKWTVSGSPTNCSASGSWSGGKSTSGGSQSLGALSSGSYTFYLTCTGPGGTGSGSAYVTVSPPASAPNVSISANGKNPLSVSSGTNVTLSWSVSGGSASSCSASGSWSGGKSKSGGSQSLGAISAGSYTYVISCSGPGGSSSASVNVGVNQAATPDLVVSAFSMPNGAPGQTVSASVTVQNNGNGSTGSGFKVAINRQNSSMNCSTSESGSTNTSALNAGASRTVSINVTLPSTGSYTAVAMADAGCAISESNESNNTRTNSYSVSSSPPPSVSITANGNNPLSITQGTNVTLNWSVSGTVTSCSAGGSWSGGKSTSGGSQSLGALSSGSYLYNLSCTGPGGSTSRSVNVVVSPPSSAPNVSINANGKNPLSVSQGTNVTLNWSVGGTVTSCSASGNWSGGKSKSGGSESQGALPSGLYTYNISCTGPNGNDSASVSVAVDLSVPPPANGQCGPAQGTTVSSQPSGYQACSAGTFNDIGDSGSRWNWQCLGDNGGSDRSCYAYKPASPNVFIDANGSNPLTGVVQGTNVTIDWNVSGLASSCNASGSWSGGKSTAGGSESQGAVSAGSHTYNISCTGPGGSNSASVNVQVVTPPAIVVLSPAGGSIDFGTVQVGSPPASKSITIRNSGGSPFTGSVAVSGAGYSCAGNCDYSGSPLAPGASRTFTVTFDPQSDNYGNPFFGNVTFNGVSAPPYVSLVGKAYIPVSVGSFTGPSGTNYEKVIQGGSLALTWSGVSGTAVRCTGSYSGDDGGWTSGSKSTPYGNQTVGPPLVNPSTYRLDCTSPYDPVGKHPYVQMDILIPVMSLSAVPVQVLKGKTSTIAWEADYYASCELRKDGTLITSAPSCYPVNCSGSFTTPGIYYVTTYTLTCHSAVGAPDDSRSIIITPFVPEYIEE